MAVSIGSNIAAYSAQRRLSDATSKLGRTFERLSSGARINRSSDDAAGLAISSTLRANSRVFSQGIRNANDAISALNIADSSIGQLSGITDRLRELALQASSGSLSSKQRASIDHEAQTLRSEFLRIQNTTKFNGIPLIGDSTNRVGVQLGVGSNAVVYINFGVSTSSSSSTSSISNYEGVTPGESLFMSGYSEVGDFNGDGLVDVVTVDFGTGDIYYQTNSGSGFGSPVYFGSTGKFATNMSSTALEDIDGDGTDDLVLVYADGDVFAFSHTEGGGFIDNLGPGVNVGVEPQIADVDGNGHKDIVVAKGDELHTFFNSGGFSFNSPTASGSVAGGNITSFTLGSYWGPGSCDLIVAAGGSVETRQGFGDGTFGSVQISTTGSYVFDAGDRDGNGLDDVVIATGTELILGISTGNGALIEDHFESLSGITDLVFGDYNNDGVEDIMALQQGTNQLHFVQADGATDFSLDQTIGSVSFGDAYFLRAGDINNDGYADALAIDSSLSTMGWMSYFSTTDSTTSENIPVLGSFSLATATGARSALTAFGETQQKLSLARGEIGASMARVNVAMNALYALRENTEAANGRIVDADMAIESAQLARFQILQQTASAVLSQASLLPSLALELLKF